jgi:DNA helicase II / ATP-dependent DNA helicase PcrA
MSSLLQCLNAPQRAAVTNTKGRLLVLAGAGSGKTRVIAHRICYLIENEQIDPKQILGLTFTNKAAKEMKERVSSLIGPQKAKLVTLSTFHSFCMKILRKEIHKLGFTSRFSLYDERDIYRLSQEIAKDILKVETLPSLAPFLSLLSDAKNKSVPIEQVMTIKSPNQEKFLQELDLRLQASLRAYNAVDFNSLLTLTVELLEKYPDTLLEYQNQYPFIHIDEFQDTNPIQYRLTELLAKKVGNLCVVGDDDQSIYGWRGAEIDHILDFEKTFTVKLEQNYRSTKTIIEAANALIQKNEKRHKKNLFSLNEEGEKISLFHAPTEKEEAQGVVDRILELVSKEGKKFSDMAILYRSNILSRNIETALLQTAWKDGDVFRRGIPYEIYGGVEFIQRSEVKDIFSYLRIIDNPKDEEALLRIINIPRRGISDQTLDLLTKMNREQKKPLLTLLQEIGSKEYETIKISYPIQKKTHAGIRELLDIIETGKKLFEKLSLSESLKALIDKIDYKKAIAQETKEEKLLLIKWENVQECIHAIKQYEEDEETQEKSLTNFLSSSLLSTAPEVKKNDRFHNNKVQVMTFHSAKGLEFPYCFLIGIEDHLLPHEKSLMETGIEEERRLFYVAITRAMKKLTFSMARVRKKMGTEIATNPSRFLHEIPKSLMQMESWKIFP